MRRVSGFLRILQSVLRTRHIICQPKASRQAAASRQQITGVMRHHDVLVATCAFASEEDAYTTTAEATLLAVVMTVFGFSALLVFETYVRAAGAPLLHLNGVQHADAYYEPTEDPSFVSVCGRPAP